MKIIVKTLKGDQIGIELNEEDNVSWLCYAGGKP